jgi:hypothetical protein
MKNGRGSGPSLEPFDFSPRSSADAILAKPDASCDMLYIDAMKLGCIVKLNTASLAIDQIRSMLAPRGSAL